MQTVEWDVTFVGVRSAAQAEALRARGLASQRLDWQRRHPSGDDGQPDAWPGFPTHTPIARSR